MSSIGINAIAGVSLVNVESVAGVGVMGEVKKVGGTVLEIVRDYFTDTDTTNIADHTPDVSYGDASWAGATTNFTIDNNSLAYSGSGSGAIYISSKADVYAYGRTEASTDQIALALNYTNTTTGWSVRLLQGMTDNIVIYESLGSIAQRAYQNLSSAIAAGDYIVGITADDDIYAAAYSSALSSKGSTSYYNASRSSKTVTNHGFYELVTQVTEYKLHAANRDVAPL